MSTHDHFAGDGDRLLGTVMDAVTVGVVVHRLDGTPLLVNAAAQALLGDTPTRVIVDTVTPSPTRELATQHPYLLRTGPGNRSEDLLVTAVAVDAPASAAAVVTTLRPNPTPARTSGEASPEVRAAVERQLLATVEHSPVGTALLTPEGNFLQANPAMRRMLGLHRERGMRSLTLAEVSHPEDTSREREQLDRLLAGEIDSYQLDKRFLPVAEETETEPIWAQVTVTAVATAPADPVTGLPGVQHLLLQALDVTEARRAVEMLAHQSLHDPLTGLANRTLCLDRIQRALDRRRRDSPQVAVLCCDLDRFKVVNDSIGPGHGDAVLVEVGQRLNSLLRPQDTAARLSGDEFVVVCTEVRGEAEVLEVAERILAALRVPVMLQGRVIVPTASIGIAVSTPRSRSAMSLLRDAGAALHRAKQNGAGSWAFVDDELRRRAVDRFDMEHQLRSGLTRGELRLHLQPIVDVASGRVVGREALVRWQHPQRGLLAPAEFLQIAEETGMIEDLGRWVLGEACRIAAATPALGYVAVNVSPIQVHREGLLRDVEEILGRTGLEPCRLVVELTESVMLSAASAGRQQLHELDRLGVRLVVDDFGTGFSALSHLRDLPVSGLKVDRTFTAGLGRDPQCERIVEALTGLAQGLGVDIVAEGVETEDQRAVLAGIGCEHAQGYLFGRPQPVSL